MIEADFLTFWRGLCKLKKEPITRSPYAYDIERVMQMSDEERKGLYTQKAIQTEQPYTVIDVLKEVYHRDFIDDLKLYISHNKKFLDLFKESSDDWRICQYWIDSFTIIRPESVFGQPIHDTLVDIYAEVRLRVLEMSTDGYEDTNVFSVNTRLRLRYTFDLRPCHLTCHYLGAVKGEESGVYSVFPDYFRADKYLLPALIKREDYERMARMIISEDMPEYLDSEEWICAIDWIQSMGLGVYIGEFPEADVMGEYFYGFGKAMVYDPESKCAKEEQIDPGTILLNRKPLDSRGKINSTSCHEGIHHRLGIYYFMLQMTHGNQMSSYMCKRNQQNGITNWTPSEIMELHANKLPAYMLIQEKPGKKKAADLFESYGGVKTIDTMIALVDDMAEYFGVTKTIAKSRLREFGYREVGGISQFIRGQQVDPYISALGKNETYTIDEYDGIQEYIHNPLFRRIIDRGNYVYADGHYCIRDKKYVYTDNEGKKRLTQYAREHMDECCLVFEYKYEKMVASSADGAMRKSVTSSKKCIYTDKLGESLVTEEGLQMRKKIELQMEERAVTIKSFNQMTVDLMKQKNITVEGLAEKTGLSEETIKNMRNNPLKKVAIEAVIAVSIAMGLSAQTAEAYIESAPNKLLETVDMNLYRYAMIAWSELSVAEVNRRLIQCGAAPLTNLIKGYNEDIFIKTC